MSSRLTSELWICDTQASITMGGGGGITSFLAPIAAAVATPFIGPELLPASLAGDAGALTATDALVGAGLGAGASAITGGNPLEGALIGGVGGGLAPNLGDIGNALGLGGGPDVTTGSLPTTTTTGAVVPNAPGLTGGTDVAAGAPSGAVGAPSSLPAINAALSSGSSPLPDFTAQGLSTGGGLAGSGIASAPSNLSAGDQGLINAASGGGGSDFSLNSAAGYPLSAGDTSTSLSDLGAAAAANPATPAAPVKAPSTLSQFISNVGSGNISGALGNIGTAAANNPGTVLGALGLGYQALTAPSIPSGAQVPAVQSQLLGQAGSLAAEGSQLQNYLNTGTLPPGAQAAIDQATNAAKQQVIANYAARGMDTNPVTNASLAQDLNAIDIQAAGQVFQEADQLLQQGVSESQLSASLYNTILQNTTAANSQLSSAINNFVTAAAGGGGKSGININLPAGATATPAA